VELRLEAADAGVVVLVTERDEGWHAGMDGAWAATADAMFVVEADAETVGVGVSWLDGAAEAEADADADADAKAEADIAVDEEELSPGTIVLEVEWRERLGMNACKLEEVEAEEEGKGVEAVPPDIAPECACARSAFLEAERSEVGALWVVPMVDIIFGIPMVVILSRSSGNGCCDSNSGDDVSGGDDTGIDEEVEQVEEDEMVEFDLVAVPVLVLVVVPTLVLARVDVPGFIAGISREDRGACCCCCCCCWDCWDSRL
jgi:hypothetical protein